jgi:hypothetical protein
MTAMAYYTNYVYDFNGNLTYLLRYNGQQYLMQQVQYDYTPNRNRLAHITGGGVAPIASSNYTYDPIGNLINDSGENLSAEWNNAGKVALISINSDIITFDYSPTGQRQRKTANNLTDYYLHDATTKTTTGK